MAKKPYQPSHTEMRKEVLKCGRDPAYFLTNYTKITHPTRGRIPFNTFDFQDVLLTDFRDHRYNVILKARQLGISTIIAGYSAWLMMFHRNKEILVMATKKETATTIVKRTKAILKSVPKWLAISQISIDNKTSIELENGSQIKASSTSSDVGRSESLSLLVIDEAAHIDGLDDLWTAAAPTLSAGGSCIACSTPNGVGNWFHKTFITSEEGENDFYPTTLMWDVHPERDADWFAHQTKNMSKRQINQEFLCDFLMSGETVIHPDDIARSEQYLKEPTHRAYMDRNLHIWEPYEEGKTYVISADVARGDATDFSACHVINVTDMVQAAEYQGKIDHDIFDDFLMDLGRQYGNCMVVIENNNLGYAVAKSICEKGYPNPYYSIKSSHEYVEQYRAETMANSVPGFTTTHKSKSLIIAKLEEYIRNDMIQIRSKRLWNELKTYVWINGKPDCMKGYNDDLIMAMAIGCWVRDTVLIENQRDMQYKKALLGSIVTETKTLDTSIPGSADFGYFGPALTKREIHEKRKKYAESMDPSLKYPALYRG
jgi:hypothetical protein